MNEIKCPHCGETITEFAELKKRNNELEGIISYISLQTESVKASVKKIQDQIRRMGE